jgi:hypothetical protein
LGFETSLLLTLTPPPQKQAAENARYSLSAVLFYSARRTGVEHSISLLRRLGSLYDSGAVKRAIVISVLVLISCAQYRAEQLPIRTYTTADGLPRDRVYKIVPTRLSLVLHLRRPVAF